MNYSKFYLPIKNPNNTKQNTSSAVILQLLPNGCSRCFDLNTATLKHILHLAVWEALLMSAGHHGHLSVSGLLICHRNAEQRCCSKNQAHALLQSSSEIKKTYFSFPPKYSNGWGQVALSVKAEQTTTRYILNECSSIHDVLGISIATSIVFLL